MTAAFSENATPKRRLHRIDSTLGYGGIAEFSLRKISGRRSRYGSQLTRRLASRNPIGGDCCYGPEAWTVLNRPLSRLWLFMDCTILLKRWRIWRKSLPITRSTRSVSRMRGHFDADRSVLGRTVRWEEWLAGRSADLALAQELGGKVVLMGHSTGGLPSELLDVGRDVQRLHVGD